MAWSDTADEINRIGVGTFGESVTYSPADEDAEDYEIDVVFSREYIEERAGQKAGVSGYRTVAGVRVADLEATPRRGDQIVRGSASYNIIDYQPDDGGGAVLVLQES